jgi:dihydrofolate reductase
MHGSPPDERPDATPKEAAMGRIVVMNHVTLDGVMQGPGRDGEDPRGGFTHSGWGLRSPQPPEEVAAAMSERMAAGGGLKGWLFGRRTYEDLLAVWNARGGPFKDALNSVPKHIASTTLSEPLPWPSSTLLRGDVAEAVGELKAETDGVLGILGSGVLIGSLMTADLIDEYLLFIHPLVLGTGRRLFPSGMVATLRLAQGVVTPAGALIVSYEPVRGSAPAAV